MNLSIHNQALLRGILAGAVVLSGVSACSRSDRAGTGRDTTESGATAVTPSDSQPSASAPQPSAGAATQPSGDTSTTTAQTRTPRQWTRPSGRRARQDTTVKSGEAAVSGYRGMDQDSSAQLDTLAAAGNTAETAGVSSDSSVSTAAADSASSEPAGTGAASPLDSAGVTSDYALTADPTSADTTTPVESDTTGIKVQLDTTHTDTLTVATADSADTTSAKSEPAAAQVANADTLQDNSGRIRPPEDSTEIRSDGNVANQSETERIRAEPTSREVPTDAAGAAPNGNTVTGIDAVSLMSRAGARCVVKDDSGDVWWDMADSPAALNPCGTGTMTLSLVRTGEK